MTARQLSQLLLAALLGGGVTAGVLLLAREQGSAGPAPLSSAAREAGVLATASAAAPLTTAEIFERVVPGIVAIRARSVQPVASVFDADGGPEQGISTGSGFVLDEDGHVVTSAQVVTGVTDVQVTFADRTLPARVVGKDEQTDLAILQVEPEGLELQPLELGDSDTVRVGDRALAVGNPTGFEPTAGSGVVAARGEHVETASGVMVDGMMRTDAVIVPGSAGGPVLGADGRVIGISSMVAEDEGALGFAVPVNTAKAVLEALQENHKLIRPYLGVRGHTVAAPAPGVLVETVYPGGPAEQVGVLPDDVIEAIDGRPVRSLEELLAAVERRAPGDEVQLGVVRDGSRTVLETTIAERPATLPKG